MTELKKKKTKKTKNKRKNKKRKQQTKKLHKGRLIMKCYVNRVTKVGFAMHK